MAHLLNPLSSQLHLQNLSRSLNIMVQLLSQLVLVHPMKSRMELNPYLDNPINQYLAPNQYLVPNLYLVPNQFLVPNQYLALNQ